jgi:hypothetical protein
MSILKIRESMKIAARSMCNNNKKHYSADNKDDISA